MQPLIKLLWYGLLLFLLKVILLTNRQQDNGVLLGAEVTCWFDTVSCCKSWNSLVFWIDISSTTIKWLTGELDAAANTLSFTDGLPAAKLWRVRFTSMPLAFQLDISFMANNCLALQSYFQLAVRVYCVFSYSLYDAVGNVTPLLIKNFIYTKRCCWVS